MADDPLSHSEEVLRRADDLDARIDEKTERVISGLVHFQDKQKRNQRWLTGVVIVLAIIIAIGAFALVKIRDNASTIEQACQRENAANANLSEIFHFFLDRPPPPNQTAEEQELVIQFTRLVDDTFAPVNCTQQAVVP